MAESGRPAAAAVPAVPADVGSGAGHAGAHLRTPLAASSRPSTSKLGASVGALDLGSEPGFGESLGRGLEVCVVVGVGVGVVVGVVVVEGVVLGEGAVMLSDGGAG